MSAEGAGVKLNKDFLELDKIIRIKQTEANNNYFNKYLAKI